MVIRQQVRLNHVANAKLPIAIFLQEFLKIMVRNKFLKEKVGARLEDFEGEVVMGLVVGPAPLLTRFVGLARPDYSLFR